MAERLLSTPVHDATVRLWGRDIGAVSWLDDRQIGVFQYTEAFAASGIQVAPLMMPLTAHPYEFPALPPAAFKGLPGMLADCLPDKFGNALIDAWLATQGRAADSLNPVERLCYLGVRGMGALEFKPALGHERRAPQQLHIDALTQLVNEVLNNRENLRGVLQGQDHHQALENILRVGTSAGGARAKAILAFNEQTGEFRSGQVDAGDGFTYWLLKFDGITNNRDKELADPQGFGQLEYACYLLARAAGVEMSECRLHREGGRAHFMTRRFDRTASGGKLHMQSLAALRHYDFNAAGAHSYEQAIETMRALGVPTHDIDQQFRRTVLNILIRNQDDHVKNIAFLMDQAGQWRLSPAFDLTYAYNPDGSWTHRHQMSLNGKRDHFDVQDLIDFGRFCDLKPRVARSIIEEVHGCVENWLVHADEAGMDEQLARRVHQAMRRDLH